ncbi:hypothetical protein [Brachyspira pilosicoli]|uniref:Uncharacterized protein n=1 Tax=Brachyspira pilosicoli (strain ATCC BAA-1826 / 95/1000) TaxID=759914 RepID=D8IE97_BRAP9|nr:hypothetical protein [Brachyspira pilosicoli]ADK31470.1 hypothetical protein BP951000_1487 [Brachyspira pilosicoli 95/1000]
MHNKVLQFINRKEFLESKYPNISCYLKTLILDDNSFSKKEKKDLFNYFFDLRKKLELPYFTTYYYGKTDSITGANFFNDIIDIIVNSLELEIKNILDKDNIDSQDIFDLFDYIVCVSRHVDKNKIIEYVNNSLLKILNILENNHTKDDEDKIKSSIDMLNYINIKINDIENVLYKIIFFIYKTKNISNKLVLELADQIGLFLKNEENIDSINKDIILFVLYNFNRNINDYNFNSIFYTKLISNILDKILDIDFEIEIFSYTFPNWLKDVLSNSSNYLFIQFILIKKIYKNGCIEKLEPKQKDFLFKYIAFHLIDTDFTLKIKDEEISLLELKDTISSYIIDVFEISEREDNFLYWQIIINYIDSQEKYDKCSKKVKKYRIRLIFSSDDPIYNIKEDDKEINNILEAKREYIDKSQKLRAKIEKYKEDKKNEKINCITKFFNFESIKEDIDFILKEFDNEEIVTKTDFFKLDTKYESILPNDIDKIIDDNFTIPIFNPFCIFYIYEISYFIFRKEEKIDINLISKTLINNWNNFYILHLYNYLIEINEFNYPFSNEEKEIIRNYFKNTDIQFPKYILVYLEKVFGFDIDLKRFCDDNSIIELLSYPYKFTNKSPMQIVIFNDALIKFEQGIIDTSLEFETLDLSYIVKKLNIDKYHLLDLCLKNIDMEDSINFASAKYYFLLSTINVYNFIDNEIIYTDKIKEIILEYFRNTLRKKDNDATFISTLLIDSVIKFNLMDDLLKLILDSNFMGIGHYNIISKWQDDIIFNDLYNKELLDYIYKIREKLMKKEITIKYSNNKNNELKMDFMQLKIMIDNAVNIKDFHEQLMALSNISNDINKKLEKHTYTKEILHYEHDNILSSLFFIDRNSNIFEYFCKLKTKDYYMQVEAMRIFDYIFNNIEQYKNSFISITNIISKIYIKLKNKINYPIEKVYTPKFELIVVMEYIVNNIMKMKYNFDKKVYYNLLKLAKVKLKNYERQIFLKSLKMKLKSYYRNKFQILPMKIYKDSSKYIIEFKEEEEKKTCENKDEILEYLNNIFNKKGKISRILEFKYLVEDIENRCITMSHPYLFEDENENQYDINNKLYISCFSYTSDKKNAYAWWKIYGSKTKFRIIIDINDFIKSIISILENNKDIAIYIGSLEYKKNSNYIKMGKNKNEWDFFKKRNDFEFENELRVMLKINSKIEDDDKIIKISDVNGLPILCSIKLQDLSIYKNINTDEKSCKNNEDNAIFHPYDKTLLDKDKKAMLSILNQLKNNI